MSGKSYDVFLSYNSEDREAVERIAVHLADHLGLNPWIDVWQLVPGEPWVQELERGIGASGSCAVFVGKSGQGPWQRRELSAALDSQVKKPGFRVIPVLLPGAPTKPELPAFLAGNTWVAFRDILDEAAFWRLECGICGRPPGRGRPCKSGGAAPQRMEPKSHADAASLVQPGGALEVDSRFYIRRKADDEVFEAIQRKRGLVTIRGPRQTGKTSMIMKAYVDAQRSRAGLRCVILDFQAFSRGAFDSLHEVWRQIAVQIDAGLDLDRFIHDAWSAESAYDRNITRFLDRCVFAENKTPLLLCMDEVDRVFDSPIGSDFFSAVRAFYNRGAWDAAWKNVRWLLSTSSEPSFFIENLSESPFNIGLLVKLRGFTTEETEEFARRHGLDLDPAFVERIMDYLGGRPYLVHLMLFHLALHPERREDLFDVETAGGGVFEDHLRRYEAHFQQDRALCEAMKKAIAGNGCDDVRLADRLEAAGLTIHDGAHRVVCSCRLYREYFRRVLEG